MYSAKSPAEYVLVVDDEPEIVTLIAYHLVNAGHRVSSAATGTEALRKVECEHPSLVVLDVMLPDMSGIDVLSTLRATPASLQVAVLLLTALRGDADRIRGLSLGADDYLTKPFNPEELVLRAGTILRRVKLSRSLETITTVGSISINRVSHEATNGGAVLDLTAIEYRLLRALVDRRGCILSRAELLGAVWGALPDMNTRTVDVHVQRLRGKLGSVASMVETIRGSGYRFNPGTGDSA